VAAGCRRGKDWPERDIRTYSRCADRFAIVRLRNRSACRRERPVLFVKAASVSCMGAEDSCCVAFDRTSRRQKWLRFLVTMPSRRGSVVLWLGKPRPRVQIARSANDRQGHDHSRRGEGLQNVAIEPKQIRLPLTQKVNPLSNCDGDEYAMSDQG